MSSCSSCAGPVRATATASSAFRPVISTAARTLSGLVRELREEICVEADRTSCRLAVVMHRAPETAEDKEYLDLFFTVEAWAGTPVIGEPDKCTELVWVPRDDVPADVVDYVALGLEAIRTGEPLLTLGW